MALGTQWRAHGGAIPDLQFDQQLDKFGLWLQTWSHVQRCELIEKLLVHMSYEQYRFLWTVLQPILHRDFMYSAQISYPHSNFQPLSTHSTRKLRDTLGRSRRNNFYRIKSAYCEFPEEVIHKNMLPELVRIHKLPFDEQIERNQRPNFSAKIQLPHISSKQILLSSEEEDVIANSKDPLLRTSDQPVRRHIQHENIGIISDRDDPSISLFKSMQLLPPNAMQVADWYNSQWNDPQKNEFLIKLLLSLDERQHFFISNFLLVKQYKDFISLLPLHISLKILSFLTPKQLAKASRVCKNWRKVCERNEIWKAKCKELNIKIDDYQPSATTVTKVNFKRLFKDYLTTLDNWDHGKHEEMELKGHAQNVLCVCLEESKHHARLASGSLDKTIKIWDLKSGQCLITLKGHTKGIWCLNFFTSSMLISGSFDTTIRVWNLETGKCMKTLLGHDGPVWSITRYDNNLVSGSQDRTVKIWDIRRCTLLKSLSGHQAAIFAVDMTKDGEFIFSASADHTVRIWNAADGNCTKVIYVNQTMAVMTVSFDKGYLACSYGEFLCLYQIGSNMDSAKLIKTYEEHHKRIESVRLNVSDPDLGQGVMVSAGKDGLIKYWSLTDAKSVQTFKGSTESITCVTFDKHRIVMASKENKIKMFDFSSK